MTTAYPQLRRNVRVVHGLGQGIMPGDAMSLPITTGQQAYIQANFPSVATYDLAAGATPSNVQLVPTPTTNYLPWIIGGFVVLLLLGRRI